ncbi:LEM-3-like GIY-YIG domain-containing protein (plasmid) [Methylomonas sp. YC3]
MNDRNLHVTDSYTINNIAPIVDVMNPYYIYSLKDPRNSPAQPFYIGKGTGNRAWEHTLRVDQTQKGRRIAEIQAAGHAVITTVLADDLTEVQALKLEAELISAFGTVTNGGILTNVVSPSGESESCARGLLFLLVLSRRRKWHLSF